MPPLTSEEYALRFAARQADDLFARRDFLKLMGASIALLSLSACRNRLPPASIVPLSHAPEGRVLGRAETYTTSFPMPDFAQGLRVTVHEGRPTKIEGNPLHPASLGATSAFAQASILGLYDPYRLSETHCGGKPSTFANFKKEFSQRRNVAHTNAGQGLALLMERTASPSWLAELDKFAKHFPKALLYLWDPIHRDEFFKGTEMAFGEPLDIKYDFKNAKTVLSIDHDFLGLEPGSVRHARDFYSGQSDNHLRSNRLYMVESSLSLTGAKADHRWPFDIEEISAFIALLEHENLGRTPPPATEKLKRIAHEISRELKSQAGDSLIVIGSHHSADLQARVHRLNFHLGNIGTTVHFRKPLDSRQHQFTENLDRFLKDIEKNDIDALFIIGGNPLFSAPSNFDIRGRLQKVKQRIHLTMHENETSADCGWVIPQHHYLESWGDVRSEDGTASLIQPLIEPLHKSVSAYELLNWLQDQEAKSDYDTVRDFWKTKLSGDFESSWRKALQTGVVPYDSNETSRPSIKPREKDQKKEIYSEGASSPYWIHLQPDPSIWDGRFGENAWLQELPKPFTNLTWDNALLISPDMARDFSLRNQDVVDLSTSAHSSFTVPVLVVEGLPARTATLHFGYGRTKTSPVNQALGFNAFELRHSSSPWFISLKALRKTDKTYALACTAMTDLGHRDDIYKETNQPPKEIQVSQPGEADLDIGRGQPTEAVGENLKSTSYQWGMAIDLNSCIGCSACVIACQAENNIPIVGKTQILNGRAMHWIRIDRYSRSGVPASGPQPITCMHCEKAPCEVVCPVEATNHSSEGLNQMVYNRCVGTRYCSNNCPYKVRRFNFYKFADEHETLKMQRNPNVSVRARGVMEKCTYCVQRIQSAHIDADKDGRGIRDGEIRTACEAVCPTQAIVFGNILDPNSRVRRLRDSVRSYGVLTELGTRPRTTYLQAMRNPNLHLEAPS